MGVGHPPSGDIAARLRTATWLRLTLLGTVPTRCGIATELDDWIRSNLAPLLRERDFRGGPRLFRRQSRQVVSLIQIQGSLANSIGPTRFTVSYGIRHDAVSMLLGGVPRPRAFDVNFAQTIFGSRRNDQWWTVPAAADDQQFATRLRSVVEQEVIPFLDRFGTEDGYRQYIHERLSGFPEFAARYLAALDRYEATDQLAEP